MYRYQRVKFLRNPASRGWVIDDLPMSSSTLRGGELSAVGSSEGRRPNYTKFRKDRDRSWTRNKVVFLYQIGWFVLKCGRLKGGRGQFARFDPCYNKLLSYRIETALQSALVLAKSGIDWNWETIFYGHYRSVFNHSDIIGQQSNRIRWKKRKIMANTPFKVIQRHRGPYQSKARTIQYNIRLLWDDRTQLNTLKYKKNSVRVFIQHALDKVAVTQSVYFGNKLPIMAPGSEVVGSANFARKERG